MENRAVSSGELRFHHKSAGMISAGDRVFLVAGAASVRFPPIPREQRNRRGNQSVEMPNQSIDPFFPTSAAVSTVANQSVIFNWLSHLREPFVPELRP